MLYTLLIWTTAALLAWEPARLSWALLVYWVFGERKRISDARKPMLIGLLLIWPTSYVAITATLAKLLRLTIAALTA